MIKSIITPQTRIGDFLDAYPELEELLFSLSPAFQKLKNPVMRRTIGRVATLQQLADLENTNLVTIINTLREAAGQNQTIEIMSSNSNLKVQPPWFNTTAISDTMDARQMLLSGQHPLGEVIKRTSEMENAKIFELITPFTPMPLIEKVQANGFEAYVQDVSDSEIHTYFCKP